MRAELRTVQDHTEEYTTYLVLIDDHGSPSPYIQIPDTLPDNTLDLLLKCVNNCDDQWTPTLTWQEGRPPESGYYWVQSVYGSVNIELINYNTDGDFVLQRIKRWAGPIPAPSR